MTSLILFLPFFSFLFSSFYGKRFQPLVSYTVASVCIFISFGVSLSYLFWAIKGNFFTTLLFPWIHLSVTEKLVLKANWSIKIDSLTTIMMSLITFISGLIHLYSYFYMKHDRGTIRFVGYLSLFTFAMLILVSAADLLQLFVGWEGVGVASYLLIGFWFEKDTANAAAIKAFFVNRIGDFFLILGIAGIFWMFGTIQYDEIWVQLSNKTVTSFFESINFNEISVLMLLVFLGCMGKSAQLGLHVWLPDAMEGPTPVSALLHSATMVTAGVFLLVRLNPLLQSSGDLLSFITLVGTFTALFAGTVALAQDDIKRVIAYSTCSQLGFMFVAIGVGAYNVAIFHLVTHAFFKSLLFLGSGSVIHAMHEEQDMKKMGGLAQKMPITHALMLIGTLALIGTPLLSGAVSKDLILEAVWAQGQTSLISSFGYFGCVFAVVLTAFYSWRVMGLTFYGKNRSHSDLYRAVHESSWGLLAPLLPLAFASIFIGRLLKESFVKNSGEFWWSVLPTHQVYALLEASHQAPWVHYLILSAVVSGTLAAFYLYVFSKEPQKDSVVSRFSFFKRKWYVDEGYAALFVRPSYVLGTFFWRGDKAVIDRVGPDGFSSLTVRLARKIRCLQSGRVYHYALYMVGVSLLGLCLGFLMGEF